MELSFIIGKRVFITGHTGFKGAWLIHLLRNFGAEVKGYALPAPSSSLFSFNQLQKQCIHKEADIRDSKSLEAAILDFQPDFIFHLAAQPLVLDSYQNPVYTFEVNQMGTVYLLESLRTLQKPCVCIVITTDKVYQDQNKAKGYVESDTLGGYDPYSASKAGCELIVDSYRSSFFHPNKYKEHQKSIATVRAGNVIGGGDFAANRLIPDIINFIERDEKVVVRNPDAIRPWQHVLDALYAYLKLAEHLVKSPNNEFLNSAWNFGPYPNDMWPVIKVANKAIEFYGKGQVETMQSLNAPKETSRLMLDINKALTNLDWRPKWGAEKAIQKTVEWYRFYKERPNEIEEFTKRQIVEFLSS